MCLFQAARAQLKTEDLVPMEKGGMETREQ